MTKIIFDYEELLAKRAEHEKAIKDIDTIINYHLNINSQTNASITTTEIAPRNNSGSRMKQAIQICENHLRQGNVVRTMQEFLNLIDSKGVKLSNAGIRLAFKKPESNIYYDSVSKTWKLK